MNWNNGIRQTHRWLSIAFTGTVVANFVALGWAPGKQQPPAWITYSPLLPLALLLFSGLYLFALPYVTKRRKHERAPLSSERTAPRADAGGSR